MVLKHYLCAMKQIRRKQIASWLLLLAFLPMLLISSVHVHKHSNSQYAEIECGKCVQHLPCDGHLNIDDNRSHECVLCQFVSLQYTPTEDVRCGDNVAYKHSYKSYNVLFSSIATVGLSQLRAAPICFSI